MHGESVLKLWNFLVFASQTNKATKTKIFKFYYSMATPRTGNNGGGYLKGRLWTDAEKDILKNLVADYMPLTCRRTNPNAVQRMEDMADQYNLEAQLAGFGQRNWQSLVTCAQRMGVAKSGQKPGRKKANPEEVHEETSSSSDED